MQTVGKFNYDDAVIFRHRKKHFPKVFRLLVFRRHEFDFVKFRDAFHKFQHFFAKLLFKFVCGNLRIFQNVVQKRRDERRYVVEAQIDKDIHNGAGMNKVRFARLSFLSFVRRCRKIVRRLQFLKFGFREILFKFLQQFVHNTIFILIFNIFQENYKFSSFQG